MNEKIREQIEADAKAAFPLECCGYVVLRPNGELERVLCRNVSPEPTHSALACPADAEYALYRGSLVATYHSHVNESSEPSKQDRFACDETLLPMYIFALPDKMWSRLIPESVAFPLELRSFVFGIQDCYDLARDYYRQHLQIELANYSRYDNFWERGEDLFSENFTKEGFVEVTDELKVHDSFLMRINSPAIANHCAIYLGNNRILHHLSGRLSRQDVLAGQWSRFIYKRLRHQSLC